MKEKNCWTLVVKTRLLWSYLAWFTYDHYDRCDRCDRWAKQRSSIVAIIAIIWKPLSSDRSDRGDNDRWDREIFLSQRSLSLRSLESGFHVIAIIAAIVELLFFSAITAMVANIWKPGFREPEKLHISAFCSLLKPGFHMIATIAVIAAIAGKCFPYERYDRCDHWTFFFLAITAIITIIWKPGFTDDVSCC